ncbi:MAG TPA: 50S ribosomal protein L10 [Thermoplasmata archaeon]|nr:50S ribosomal protein L10 [Thermoplasmata archaeon]
MAHVAPYKQAIVKDLVSRFEKSKVVGLANIHGIPAPQFQGIRKNLAGRASILVAKNNLIRLALKEAATKRKGLEALAADIDGQTAVITADVNPFKLFKELEKTKTPAPARGGEIAPMDIWVREGETPFKPGPVVGELQKAGLPAAIEKGKVVIKKDKLVCKAGDKIPREAAQVLARLEIFPLIVGLDLKGAYEDGMVYHRDALAVDDVVVRGQISQAGREALALALEIGYPAKETVPLLLAKAAQHALSLSIESGFPTKDSVKFLLAKAQAQALALSSAVPAAPADESTKESG